MFEHILLPVDGSSVAECVLPHAAALAQMMGAEVTVVRVLEESTQASPTHAPEPLDWHLLRAEAQSYLEQVKQYLAGTDIEVKTELLTGDPAAQIVEYSHETPVDLIILSSHGRSGLSGWSVSSVVQKVIHRANTSFMIVRAYKYQEERPQIAAYETLLVPLDGSRRAECVFPAMHKLAQTSDVVPLLVRVVRRPEMPRRTPLSPEDAALADKLVERNQQEAAQYLADLKSQLDFEVNTRVIVTDDLIAALHDLAEELASDLVLVSAHGYTGGTSRPYGSVTTSFIDYGNSPLLVVQDLPQGEIEASEAEKVAAQAVRTSRSAGGRAVVNAE